MTASQTPESATHTVTKLMTIPKVKGLALTDAHSLIDLTELVDSMIAAATLAAQKALLERLKQEARETKDVKTGAILQTVGLGYIFNELAALERQHLGKESTA